MKTNVNPTIQKNKLKNTMNKSEVRNENIQEKVIPKPSHKYQ